MENREVQQGRVPGAGRGRRGAAAGARARGARAFACTGLYAVRRHGAGSDAL